MSIVRRFTISLLAFSALGFAVVPVIAQKPPIEIAADLTDAPRKLYHAEVDLPVTPGPVSLTTAQWIPGHHMPSGPNSDIVGVVFTANGKTVPWWRDDVDLYEFHLNVPSGVTRLHAHLDCIVTARVSQKLAMLEWEDLMLYPARTPVRDILIQASIKVPAGWGIGTAMTPVGDGSYPVPAAGSTTKFTATDVEQLEDSPVITGEYFHEFALAPSITPKHFIDVVSDEPDDSNLSPQVLADLSSLVREADALYDSHHYHVYHFLLTLSDVAGVEGLEHGQSSDNGAPEKTFADAAKEVRFADLLPHEFTHSWNGKHRRPSGLYQPDFATPQQGALLWVYEGMTEYLGDVLAARSGLRTQAQYRDVLAQTAAELDYTPGREWRPTEDTAVAASIVRGGNPAWVNWRRSQDYYDEGELLWLDVDTKIRQLTGNKKSLDSFERIFLGKGGNTGPLIVPYKFDELVEDLNAVVPYNWATFLHDRVDNINPRADFAGIEQGGYRLVYKDKPNPTAHMMTGAGGRSGDLNTWFSIGLQIGSNGSIHDVRWNGPGDKAQLAPGEKIIAVDGRIFSPDALRDAIRAVKDSSDPIRLIVQAESFVYMRNIDYHEGERFPVLERVDGTPDYLDDITAPLTHHESPAGDGKKAE